MAGLRSASRRSTTSTTHSNPQNQESTDGETIMVYTETMELALSPESGSGNESGHGSDQHDELQSPADSTGHESANGDRGDEDAAESTQAQMPVQKRRRVTRACDECRRKKIKCDGKQPCTHCSVYSYGKT